MKIMLKNKKNLLTKRNQYLRTKQLRPLMAEQKTFCMVTVLWHLTQRM